MPDERAIQVDGLIAASILVPGDRQELAVLLRQSADERCPVIPLGGGTMLDLGAPLARADRVVSLAGLNQVQDHQPANLTVRADAGITLGALNRQLGEHGQFLPLDPPFPDRATLGGILASNASGPLRVRFGSARDLVIGVRVALADGQIVRGGGDVVKNVAGYDLPKLFIGSLGTLGIIVEASLKIAPLPASTSTVIASFDNSQDAADVALRLLRSPFLPIGIELVDRPASADMGLGEGYTLVVRFGGLASAIEQQNRELGVWSREKAARTVTVQPEDNAVWSRLRDYIYERETVVKITVQPSSLGGITLEAEQRAAESGVQCRWLAHANGILLVALAGELEAERQVMVDLRKAAATRRGSLIVQKGPRVLREQVDVWGPTRGDFAVMQRIKQEFDPARILNPGRFVGGI